MAVMALSLAFHQLRMSAKSATPMMVIAAATSTPRTTAQSALLSLRLPLLRDVRLKDPSPFEDAIFSMLFTLSYKKPLCHGQPYDRAV